MISEKENMRRFYFHEKAEWMPAFGVGFHFLAPQNGYLERPQYNLGGKDWFGVDWVYQEGEPAPVPDSTRHVVLDDICNWREQVKFPDLDAWDWSEAQRIDKVNEIDRENNLLYLSILCGLFERLHSLMGFENAMIALIAEPEETAAFFDAMVEYKCKLIDKLAKYYTPDILNFHDDWGTQRALFFSPNTWRTLIKPRMKIIIDCAHRYGMTFELHSCGLIQDIIPEICELGVDCLQCMDLNDIVAMKKITGKKMNYNVSFDQQKHERHILLGDLKEEDLRRDIREEVMAFGKDGCYYPFYQPGGDKWKDIIHDEVCKCRAIMKSGLNINERGKI
jgi:hypothetical protein